MKTLPRSRRPQRTPAAERAQLLAAFDGSGLSAAAFARQHGLRYITFCGWRHKRVKLKPSPFFVQVELATPTTGAGLVVELGGHARLRIESARQIALATQLRQHLRLPPCASRIAAWPHRVCSRTCW